MLLIWKFSNVVAVASEIPLVKNVEDHFGLRGHHEVYDGYFVCENTFSTSDVLRTVCPIHLLVEKNIGVAVAS